MKLLKKTGAFLLSAVLAAGLLTGCGQKKTGEAADASAAENKTVSVSSVSAESTAKEPEGFVSSNRKDPSSTMNRGGAAGETLSGISYIMIYNPFIYDESAGYENGYSLSSGSLGSQIVTGVNRAGGLEIEVPKVNADNLGLPDDFSFSPAQQRGSGMNPSYKKGDKHSFYYFTGDMNYRKKDTFTCVGVGDSCYIWSVKNSIKEGQAVKVAREFDNLAYPADIENFGKGRFTENGGKVNILFYPMPDQYLGLFSPLDIFAKGECPAGYEDSYGMNFGHAIIGINSLYVDYPEEMNRTLAHEFQHQISATDTLVSNGPRYMNLWIDETMSAAAEEIVYPGSKLEYGPLVYLSDNYRTGQSLYDFTYENDEYIGAYGIVYLFEEYLRENNGSDSVFLGVHDSWRSGEYSEAKALVNAVTQDFCDEIFDKYTYPDSIRSGFSCAEEEWMSKLTLDFFLSINDPSAGGLNTAQQKDAAHTSMLYDSVSPAYIEGGGRIIAAVKGGSYTIPADSDNGLIYIGLDKNFEPATGLYTSEGPVSEGSSGGSYQETVSASGSFEWNGELSLGIIAPSSNVEPAKALASGLADGIGVDKYDLGKWNSVDQIAEYIDMMSGDGVIVVFGGDTDVARNSNVKAAAERAFENGCVVMLINNKVPAGETSEPFAIAFNTSGLCPYSEMTYYPDMLTDIGVTLSEYVYAVFFGNELYLQLWWEN